MVIRDDQLTDLSGQTRRPFLLTTVCDWFAVYEHAYGSPATTSFDEAWDLADHVMNELDGVTWEPNADHTYALVHEVLLAREKGAETDCIDRALTAFCDALPSDEAGFALLRMELKPELKDEGSC